MFCLSVYCPQEGDAIMTAPEAGASVFGWHCCWAAIACPGQDLPDVPDEVAKACLSKDSGCAHAFAQRLLAAEKREIALGNNKSKAQTPKGNKKNQTAKKKAAKKKKAAAKEEEEKQSQEDKEPKKKKSEPSEYMQRKNSFMKKLPGCRTVLCDTHTHVDEAS